jgi:hypothetical protein
MVRQRVLRSAVLAMAAATALTLAPGVSPPLAAHSQSAPALADLSGLAELRTQFNDDRGHVRLVLLLSPT